MNRSYPLVIIITVIVAIAATVGIAYAYQSVVSVGGNTVVADDISIDVYYGNEHDPIDSPFLLPEFEKDKSKTITGYSISTTGPGTVTVKCDMKHSASWVFIDSMSININGNDYAFGKVGESPNIQTGVPTEFSVTGGSGTFYDFTITVDYADIDPAAYTDGVLLSGFPESAFLFTFRPS